MTITVLRWADYTVVPWQNGGGITREVLARPAGVADFDWRVSIADVGASSQFSRLPGIDRVIVPLDAAPMVLTVDGVEHRLTRFRPFSFDGAATTSCVVEGSTRDLNVMTRRGARTASVRVADTRGSTVDGAGRASLVMVLAGTCSVVPPGETTVTLGVLDALLLEGGATCRLDGDGLTAVVRID